MKKGATIAFNMRMIVIYFSIFVGLPALGFLVLIIGIFVTKDFGGPMFIPMALLVAGAYFVVAVGLGVLLIIISVVVSVLKARRKRRLMMRNIFILGFVFLVAGCGLSFGKDYHLDEKSFTTEWLKVVEKETGVTLPVGSRGMNMFYKGDAIDPSFVAKVEVPTSSQEALVKQIEQIRDMDGSVSGSLTEKVAWWTPSEATIRVKRQFTLDGSYVQVLLCQENDRWMLYLEWITV